MGILFLSSSKVSNVQILHMNQMNFRANEHLTTLCGALRVLPYSQGIYLDC